MSDPSQAAPGAQKELTGRIGKYEIVQPLGRGAMGMVYLAHDTILERDVALKVMVSQIADDPDLNKRFEREAKAVARMSHPNVVAVFDLGNHADGSPYLAMELLKGQDLQKALRTQEMSVDRKVAIISQVLAGLAHAHQAGIVHRDIKPANIFINHDGTVKIMDFGVARLTTASMTGTGNIVGTADYMSPEQVKGAKVDGRSDLFSVGCMLYELLTGKRPFHSENLMAIFYKITHEEPNFELIPEGPEYDALLPILRKALAKELADRYQSAYEFAGDLKEYLKKHATSASGESALEGLLDIEPPPDVMPEPITDTSGPTLISPEEEEVSGAGATMALGQGGPRTQATQVRGGGTAATMRGPGTSPGTARSSAPTVVGRGTGVGPAPTRIPGTVVRPAPAAPPRKPAPPPPERSNAPIYAIVGVLAVGLLALGGYVVFGPKQPPQTVVITQVTQPPGTTAPATAATPVPPPPTAAPPPTFAEAQGKGAVALRAAQAAFRRSDYAKAVEQAQAALREDPGNTDAGRLLDNAVKGQEADGRFRAADAAIRQNDFAKALSEAAAGREAAPWDDRGPALVGRIQQAQQHAQSQADAQRQAQAAAQANALLAQADTALAGQKYDEAIRLYDEVLKVDATNQRATLGKTSAVGARAVAQAAAAGPKPAAGKTFQQGKTAAQAGSSSGSVPAGFEETPGVVVRRGTATAELPGKIAFDIDPESPKPGDRYTVKIFMVNEGTAPIQLTQMVVGTKVNGRGAQAPVPPLARDVAPAQRALLLTLPDVWKEDTASWTLEVTVRTVRGEKYTNSVSWK